MRAAGQLLAVMFALLICAACGGDPQADPQTDISGVVDPYCEQMVDCEWWDDFRVCRQFILSGTAALTYVYGEECGNAWLDVMDCETFIACDVFYGCQAEYDRLYALCF